MATRVHLAKALGECVATQEGFLALLDQFVEGTAVKAELPELLRRVRCRSCGVRVDCWGGLGSAWALSCCGGCVWGCRGWGWIGGDGGVSLCVMSLAPTTTKHTR